MTTKYLLVAILFLSSCAYKGTRNNDDETEPLRTTSPDKLKLKVATLRCPTFEIIPPVDDGSLTIIPTGSVATLVIGGVVDYFIGFIQKKIKEAASKKDQIYETVFTDYMLEINRDGKYLPRNCIAVALSQEIGLQENAKNKLHFFHSYDDSDLVPLSEDENSFTLYELLSDMGLLFDELRFFSIISFSDSDDYRAIKPYVSHLYIPEKILKRNKQKETYALSIEASLPKVGKNITPLSLTLSMPLVEYDDINIKFKDDATNSFWIAEPSDWATKNDGEEAINETHCSKFKEKPGFCQPVNVSAKLVVTSHGSKLAKAISNVFTDNVAAGISKSITTELTQDSETISNEATNKYLGLIADYHNKMNLFEQACNGSQESLKDSTYYAALLSYRKLINFDTSSVLHNDLDVDTSGFTAPEEC